MFGNNTNNEQEDLAPILGHEYIEDYFRIKTRPKSQAYKHIIEDYFVIKPMPTKPTIRLDVLNVVLVSNTVDGASSGFVPTYAKAKAKVNWAQEIATTIPSQKKSETEFQQTLSDIEEEQALAKLKGSCDSELMFEMQDLPANTNAANEIALMPAKSSEDLMQEKIQYLQDKIVHYGQRSVVLTHLYKEELRLLQQGLPTQSANVDAVANKTAAQAILPCKNMFDKQAKSKRKPSKVSPNNSYNSSSEPSDNSVNSLKRF